MLVSKFPIFDPAGVVIMVGGVLLRIRADFTYNIPHTIISIVDAGLGKCSITEDIEAVLRKIEYWHQGSYISVCHAGVEYTSVRFRTDSAMSPRQTKSFLA
jgi:hypothetical protein